MKRLTCGLAAVPAILLPTALLAHETAGAHVHPHGYEWAVLLGALTVVAFWLVMRRRR